MQADPSIQPIILTPEQQRNMDDWANRVGRYIRAFVMGVCLPPEMLDERRRIRTKGRANRDRLHD